MMVIQALGGNRRINIHNHNSAPFVVVLVSYINNFNLIIIKIFY